MPTEICDKYEIIRTLHQTAATTVYLIRHKTLGEIRVLKSCIRDSSQTSELLSEANLLSGIHFTGIPTIFDFYQDLTTDYLVEEYISGMPLSEMLHSDSKIELFEAIDIMCGVLDILEHFHTCNPPVIYRDLKPEHIIVCSGGVKIIDMGIATRKGTRVIAKGTKGYASPEQLIGEMPSESFDIYAAGCVFKELLYKVTDKKKDIFIEIANKASEEMAQNRYVSAKEMRMAICDRKQIFISLNDRREHLLRIAVIGGYSAVGCTNFAISLTCYLNKLGLSTYYVDRSDGRVLQNIEKNITSMKTKDGVICHKLFYGWMEYGPAVEPLTPPEGIYIYDCGYVNQMPADADIGIFICSSCPWKEMEIPSFVQRSNCIVVANCTNRVDAIRIAKVFRKNVYRFPWVSDPFSVCEDVRTSLNRIASGGLGLKEKNEGK